VVAAGTLVAARTYRLGGDAAHGRSSGVMAAWREPRTLLVGLLVLVLAFTEGTANDWVAVAFIDGHEFDPAAGAVVFGVFVTTMTFGRIFGTIALDRWGRVPVLLVTMVLAAAGVALAVFGGSPVVAVAGVAVWGLGTALGFPVGMSAAADDPAHAAARVSVVAVIGYTAFLAGPPLVGLLGDQVGVLRALLVVPLLLLPALALVPALRQPAAGGVKIER
jgi:MFS family permease